MISVVIPLYNTEPEFFKECVDSVVAQTIKDIEVLIIDNGSSQENIKNYKSHIEKYDNFKFFEIQREYGKKNLSIALNYGIKKSSYGLIARMDADDRMLPDRLQKQYTYFLNNNVDILGGQLKYMDSTGITRHPMIIEKETPLRMDWFLNHPTVMFKKESIERIGGYHESPEYLAEDYELWLRSLKNNLIIHNLSDILIEYRVHSDNLTSMDKTNPMYEKLFRYIKDGYINHFMRV